MNEYKVKCASCGVTSYEKTEEKLAVGDDDPPCHSCCKDTVLIIKSDYL